MTIDAVRSASQEWSYRDCADCLIDHGADITADDNYAVRWASKYGNTETVKLLIDYGADITANEQCTQYNMGESEWSDRYC